MRDTGVLSVNEIRALEDLPFIDGGDTHYASLNYVPLSEFVELSRQRAGGEKKHRRSNPMFENCIKGL